MGRKKKPAEEDPSLVDVGDVGDEEEDDDGEEEAARVAGFLDPTWVPPKPKAASERKVTNKYIPLFPDATKDPKRHAASIKIYKANPPGDGFKGIIESPETVDEAFLASLYGNGIFKLELLDQQKNVLRTRDNLKVDVPVPAGSAPSNGHGTTDIESIVTKLTAANEAALEKVLRATEERLAREEARLKAEREAERERSKQHVEMTTSLVRSEGDSMRAFYAAQQAAAEKGSQTLLAMMQTGHAQTMEIMRAAHEAQSTRSDPLLFLKVFQEGMHMAPGEDGAAKVTDNIVKGLSELRGLAGADPASKKLPASTTTSITKKPNPGAPANGAQKEISKDELKEVVLLKRVLKSRGMTDEDFLALVRKAKVAYADPDQPITEEVDDEDDEDEAPPPPKRRKKKKAAAHADTAAKPEGDVDGAEPPDA